MFPVLSEQVFALAESEQALHCWDTREQSKLILMMAAQPQGRHVCTVCLVLELIKKQANSRCIGTALILC